MSENKEIETAFSVVIYADGTFATSPDPITDELVTKRSATNFDIYQIARQVVQEVDNALLVDRIVATLMPILNPTPESVSDKVKEALAKRGVTPEGE